jgi:DNA-binding MarR family transcriptional regulator
MASTISDTIFITTSPIQTSEVIHKAVYNHGPISTSKLARKLNLPRRKVARVLHKLTDDGFLIRAPDLMDMRILLYTVTKNLYSS